MECPLADGEGGLVLTRREPVGLGLEAVVVSGAQLIERGPELALPADVLPPSVQMAQCSAGRRDSGYWVPQVVQTKLGMTGS
jgi:hypothetical protein